MQVKNMGNTSRAPRTTLYVKHRKYLPAKIMKNPLAYKRPGKNVFAFNIILYFCGTCGQKSRPAQNTDEATNNNLLIIKNVVMSHNIFTFRFVSPYILTDGGD